MVIFMSFIKKSIMNKYINKEIGKMWSDRIKELSILLKKRVMNLAADLMRYYLEKKRGKQFVRKIK